MRKRELTKLLVELGKLTPLQRRQVEIELRSGESRESSIALVEEGMSETPECPHCKSKTVVRNGTSEGLQRYKCRGCTKTFNALTGTPLAKLRMKGKWIVQAEVLRDGLTIKEAAKRMNVSEPTAFRWRHRFLALPKTVKAQALVGIVETDETYFLESHKGCKTLAVIGRKRGEKAKKRDLSAEQIPVLVTRDRAGATTDCVLKGNDAKHVIEALESVLSKDSILCTDGSRVLAAAAKGMGVVHRPVNLAAGKRVIGGVYHVQNVNPTTLDSRVGCTVSTAWQRNTLKAIWGGFGRWTGQTAV